MNWMLWGQETGASLTSYIIFTLILNQNLYCGTEVVANLPVGNPRSSPLSMENKAYYYKDAFHVQSPIQIGNICIRNKEIRVPC